jgi:hypothetical protein
VRPYVLERETNRRCPIRLIALPLHRPLDRAAE